jgi:hypothetical protein
MDKETPPFVLVDEIAGDKKARLYSPLNLLTAKELSFISEFSELRDKDGLPTWTVLFPFLPPALFFALCPVTWNALRT